MRKEYLRGVSAVLVLSMTGIGNVHADIDKVYGTTVEQGELEVELRGVHVIDDDFGREGDSTMKIGVGYGAGARWFVEGYLEVEDTRGENPEIEAYELENRFQLTEQGEYFADFGLLVEVEKVRELDIIELKGGPLIQKDFGNWTGKANLLVERQFGDDKTEDEWEFFGRAQLKYRLSPAFEPGIEYHGDEYTHAVGLVGMGLIGSGRGRVMWLLGAYAGLDDDTPDTQVRWELEFEF